MALKPMKGSLKEKQIKKKKKVVRNVLTLREDTYWPIIPDSETSEVENILKEHLSSINCCLPKVPWHILMKMTREERKIKMEQETQSLSAEEKEKNILAKKSRSYLAIGVNNSIRLMEQKKLLFCLIDSSGQPTILLEKLLALSKEKQILSALVPNLKETLKNILGFKAFVLGFKESLFEDDCSIKGCLKIKEILERLNLMPSKNVMDVETKKQPVTSPIKQERLSNIYLYRTDENERVFHPNSTEIRAKSNFIGVNYGSSHASSVTKKTFKRYMDEVETDQHPSGSFDHPLILTVQSNSNKRKKR